MFPVAWIIMVISHLGITQGVGLFEIEVTSVSLNEISVDVSNMSCRPSSLSAKVCLLHFIIKPPEVPSCLARKEFLVQTSESPNFGGKYERISLPIKYSWPGTVSLVIDVILHPCSGDAFIDENTAVSKRLFHIQETLPSKDWHNTTLAVDDLVFYLQFRMQCVKHYYGKNCTILCQPRNDRFGHYYCTTEGHRVCRHGWEGSYCERAVCPDNCPKQNSFCKYPFVCRCTLGWRGRNCSECVKNKRCVNGYCQQPNECLCEAGWTGKNCDIKIDYCATFKPCHNGGTCIGVGHRANDLGRNYTCLCKDNHFGSECERTSCPLGHCLHGGTCRVDAGELFCSCPREFEGKHCEITSCNYGPFRCLNGGICIVSNKTNTSLCHCPRHYEGSSCQTRAIRCDSEYCLNGATCVGINQCNCSSDYFGKRCESRHGACDGVVCRNRGFCKQYSGVGVCICPSGFTGKACESDVLQADENRPGKNMKETKSSADRPLLHWKFYVLLISIFSLTVICLLHVSVCV